MRGVFLLLAILPTASGQPFSFGIKGGGVATSGLDPAAQDAWEGKPYTFGPAVEFRLPFRLAAEVDALYRRAGDRNQGCIFGTCFYSSVRAGIFEFPMLVKYRVGRGAARPFAAAGVSIEWVRHASGRDVGTVANPFVLNSPAQYVTYSLANPAETHVGAVMAGGVEFRVGRMRLAPEFRYTRWSGRYWEFSGPRGYFTGSNRNQAEALFGILF